MEDQNNRPTVEPTNEPAATNPPETPVNGQTAAPPPPPPANVPEDDRMNERLERLGGEPAPAITPEEFARLQRAGQVHIDAQGRVRAARRSDAEAGVSLKKRRAWYERQ
ncbi:MAG: hypothetical protein HZC41_24140 [Chloroflexi bacterium]|nr:hypothetical protein [Chloroflexota bacterium]